jgi:hypothetical protein
MSLSFCKSYDENRTPVETVNVDELSVSDFQMLKYPLEKINFQITNFYADIDLKVNDINQDEFQRIRSVAIDGFSKLEGYVFTDGSYYTNLDKKLSFHIHNRMIQIYKQSFTWNSEYGKMLKNQLFVNFSKEDATILEKGLDDSVYGNKSFLRTPYSLITTMSDPSKNKLHPHKPMVEAPIQNYLVTAIPDKINIHPLMKKLSNKKVEEETYKSLSYVMSLSDEEGITKPRTHFSKEVIEELLKCIDPVKRAYHHMDWIRLAFMIKSVLGQEGVEHFIAISKKSGYEKFSEHSCRAEFNAIQDKNNKISIGSLIFWAKEDNQEQAMRILAKKKVVSQPDSVIVYSDAESGKVFYEQVKSIVRISNGIRYVKNDRVWINNQTRSNEATQHITLMNRCRVSNIYLQSKDKPVAIYSSLKGAKTIIEEMWLNVSNDPEFADKLALSALGKICFNNGIYDFVKNRFMTWDEADEVYTESIVNDDFKEATKDEIEATVQLLASCIGEERVDDFLRFYSRAMAGCFNDKFWVVITGFRDSGKGVLVDLFLTAFGPYVGSFDADNLMVERMGNGDIAKKMSWTMSIKDKRVAFSSEVTIDENAKHKPKFDGNRIKRLTSGGDKIIGRTNYKDESNYYFIPKLATCLNDMGGCTPTDVQETCIIFKCPFKFYSKSVLDEMERMGKNMNSCKLADDTLKSKIRSGVFTAGFRSLIFKYYRNEKYIPSPIVKQDCEMFKDDEFNEFELIETTFEFTGHKNDFITLSMMKSFIDDNNLNMTIKKVKFHLERIGGLHSKTIFVNGQRNVTGITGIKLKQKE